MAVAENLKFLFAISFAGCVAADSGDDFSNNLFSDLAPLLALFGERVTMQFMSQSMGWADNIILAMAPLGIITAIVSAIRVGGPSWLKAIIGRARENRAVAEAELMSSTSDEVCELWNGQEVVRVMGTAPIREFICLFPPKGVGGKVEPVTRDLDSAINDVFEKYEPTIIGEIPFRLRVLKEIWNWASRLRARDEESAGGDEKGTRDGGNSKNATFTMVGDTRKDAPNISLNIHNRQSTGELWLVAVVGTLLQLGVLVYSGFATYYPSLMFLKNDLPIATYAYPCTATGTLVLVTGMLLCANVVESSTEEKRYRTKDTNAPVIWLQKAGTVNDQSFGSFAIFAKTPQRCYITSRRLKPPKSSAETPSTSTNRLGNAWTRALNKVIKLSPLGFKAVASTIISLCGFIVQFIGLRGMHWSASIAQLVATMVMAILRACVRRRLADPPKSQPLTPGFEIDWLAITLGGCGKHGIWKDLPKDGDGSDQDRGQIPDATGCSCDGGICWDGGIETGEDRSKLSGFYNTSIGDSEAIENGSHLGIWKPQRVMVIRRDLGELSGWPGSASAVAVSVARAIEVTMDALFGTLTGKFTWSLKACGGELINLHIERQQNGTWKACSDEIEAALSLWLFSANEKEGDKALEEEGKRTLSDPRNDAWLRAQGTSAKPGLRLLGSYSATIKRDLKWWMPQGGTQAIKVKGVETVAAKEDSSIEVKPHRIVGSGYDSGRRAGERTWKILEETSDSEVTITDSGITDPRTRPLLAAVSYGPLKLLYAQDMFSAFMWAAAKTLTKPINGGADIRPADTNEPDNLTVWQSFTLRNDQLSKMAQDIQSTGLGSLEDIYLSIIPPLSVGHKLPQADAIIELARQHAKRHELVGHWKEAGDAYLWLFRTAKTFPEQSGIAAKSTAVLMEYLRQVASAIDLREARHEEREIQGLKNLKSDLETELKHADAAILSSLTGLYKEQGRRWKSDLVQEAESAKTEYPKTFNRTKLHYLAQSDHEISDALQGGENVNAKDILDWTPLHYAAAKGSADVAKELVQRQAHVNTRDLLEWTPLHYACRRGEASILQVLLREGADIDAQGRDGVAPLHCAAMSGKLEVVRSLIEAGAATDVLDTSGNTPLLWAAYKGHKDVVGYLWPDANKKLRDHDGRTALHLAAIAGIEEVIRWLVLELGADKEAKDREGWTPLHLAAHGGHEAVVRLLVELGADNEAKNKRGQTPLHSAALGGHGAVVRLLVDEFGADNEAKDRERWTPLHLAAFSGHEAVVRLLVNELGADKEAKGTYNWTLLHLAALNGHEAVVRLLVDKLGADKEAKDGFNRTPLHLAALNERNAVVRLLDELGADKEAKDGFEGWTPLHLAAHGGHEAVVRLLVELGADNEAKNKRGQTPLHEAALGGHEAVVRLLVDKLGADKEAKDGFNRTPLHWAAHGGHGAVVRLLVELGADNEAKDEEGQTPLRLAALNRHEAVVGLLE